MPRKWMFLAAVMASVSVLTVGIAGADDEDSPLHKLMERVNAKNLAITKGVRTAPTFKKSQSDVVAAAEELTKLATEARELGKDTIKKAKEVPNAPAKWNELMDQFASSSANLVKEAGKTNADQVAVKAAHTAVKKSCTECHTLFRIEEE